MLKYQRIFYTGFAYSRPVLHVSKDGDIHVRENFDTGVVTTDIRIL